MIFLMYLFLELNICILQFYAIILYFLLYFLIFPEKGREREKEIFLCL